MKIHNPTMTENPAIADVGLHAATHDAFAEPRASTGRGGANPPLGRQQLSITNPSIQPLGNEPQPSRPQSGSNGGQLMNPALDRDEVGLGLPPLDDAFGAIEAAPAKVLKRKASSRSVKAPKSKARKASARAKKATPKKK